jgi:hypothetical protein
VTDQLFSDRSQAAISDCGTYRYWLRREWDAALPHVVFFMLNPSTADAAQDDPTIRRCVGFAKSWGCGALEVVNLFAYRATDPRALFSAVDPVGEQNHDYIRRAVDRMADAPKHIVCAWGAHGDLMGQDETVLGWIEAEGRRPEALKLTKAGHPSHPLYLAGTLTPFPFKGASWHRRNVA